MNTAAPEHLKELKISKAIVTAWRDARDALRALFVPALVTFLILLALWIARAWIIVSTTGLEMELYVVVYGGVQALLMTPYAIAVQRFIILGEKTASYRIALTEPRVRRFFGWSLALSVLYNVAAAISAILPPLEEPLNDLLGFVLSIAVLVLAIRGIVLFPAVAVDVPGANWLQAIADTSGHAWRIFLVILIAMLPLFIVNVILAFVVGSAATPIPGLLASTFLWYPLAILLVYTLAAVIASRLYQWIGVRVKEGA